MIHNGARYKEFYEKLSFKEIDETIDLTREIEADIQKLKQDRERLDKQDMWLLIVCTLSLFSSILLIIYLSI